jgi:hypothetical protein
MAMVRKRFDDALGHVHGDRDRRALGCAGYREQDDSGGDVVEVLVAAAGYAGQAGAHGVAEDVDEQQQEDDRYADRSGGRGGVAQRAAEVAPHHRRRVL